MHQEAMENFHEDGVVVNLDPVNGSRHSGRQGLTCPYLLLRKGGFWVPLLVWVTVCAHLTCCCSFLIKNIVLCFLKGYFMFIDVHASSLSNLRKCTIEK